MGYPLGAFEEMVRMEAAGEKFEKARHASMEVRSFEVIEAAKQNTTFTWADDMGRIHTERPAAFVVENLPAEIIEEAVRAFLEGKDGVAAILFKSACEVGFERGIEFLADVDAERAE